MSPSIYLQTPGAWRSPAASGHRQKPLPESIRVSRTCRDSPTDRHVLGFLLSLLRGRCALAEGIKERISLQRQPQSDVSWEGWGVQGMRAALNPGRGLQGVGWPCGPDPAPRVGGQCRKLPWSGPGASLSRGCGDCEGNKLNRRPGRGGARLEARERKRRRESAFGGVGESEGEGTGMLRRKDELRRGTGSN